MCFPEPLRRPNGGCSRGNPGAFLVQLGRFVLDLESPEFTRALGSVRVWPLDLAVCRQSTRLDFHGDAADELIAATSVVHHVPFAR